MSRPEPGAQRVALNVLAGLVALAASYYIVATVAEIHRNGWEPLAADQWRIYSHYLTIGFVEKVLTPDDGHVSIFPGLMEAVDILYFDASNRFSNGLGLLLLVATPAVISLLLWRDAELPWPSRVIAAAAAWVLVLWLPQFRMQVSGTGALHTYLTTTSLVVALWALGTGERSTVGRVVLALLCGVVASFSIVLGVSVWASMLLVAVLRRRERWVFIALAAASAACAAVFLVLYGTRGGVSANAFPDPLLLARDVCRFVGAPIEHLTHGLGPGFSVPSYQPHAETASTIVGAAALVAAGVLLVKRLRSGEPATPLESAAFGMLLFGLGAGGVVGTGKLLTAHPGGFTPAAPRYLPWPCIFWAGGIILGCLAAQRLRRGQGVARLVWAAAVCGFGVLMLPAHLDGLRKAQGRSTAVRAAALSLVLGIEDDEVVENDLFRSAPKVYRVAAELRKRGLNMFAWEIASHVNQPFKERFRMRRDAGVPGIVTEITAFPDRDRQGARFRGHAVDLRTLRTPEYVVVRGPGGTVQGLGEFVGSHRRLVRKFGLPSGTLTDFVGHIADYDPDKRYVFYAVIEPGVTGLPLRIGGKLP